MNRINLCSYPADRFWSLENLEVPVRPSTFNPAFFYASLFHATNRERTNFHLNPLAYSELLKTSATLHSGEMNRHNFFSHENQATPALRNVFDRVHAAGGTGVFDLVGENIADYPLISSYSGRNLLLFGRSFGTWNENYDHQTYRSLAQSIVDGWMNSPGHRANILNPQFCFVGFGVSFHRKIQQGLPFDYILCTQNFGGKIRAPGFSLKKEMEKFSWCRALIRRITGNRS